MTVATIDRSAELELAHESVAAQEWMEIDFLEHAREQVLTSARDELLKLADEMKELVDNFIPTEELHKQGLYGAERATYGEHFYDFDTQEWTALDETQDGLIPPIQDHTIDALRYALSPETIVIEPEEPSRWQRVKSRVRQFFLGGIE